MIDAREPVLVYDEHRVYSRSRLLELDLQDIERNFWSVVLIGSFNPTIFHPTWFQLNGLVSEEVAETAQVEVVHNELSRIHFEKFRVLVEKSRFQVEIERSPEIQILDLTRKVFLDVLPHSLVHSFGINRNVHFNASSPEKRIEIGRAFAPTEPWGEFGTRIKESDGKTTGGLMSLRMREILDEDSATGHLEAKLEPSNVLSGKSGVFVAVNRHFKLKNYSEASGAIPAMKLLGDSWDESLRLADEIISNIVEASS